MGLKEDADFARYLSMGAVGTAAVATDLRDRFGHQPVELERYSMANKIWTVKVKRLRIPDLLCVRCGRRVESKAKSNLEVKLSDSATVGREWHAGGLRADDLVAFVRVHFLDTEPVAGSPAYFTAEGLKAGVDHARKGTRKSPSQGAEIDISWPMWVPTIDGTFVGIRSGHLIYRDARGLERDYWYSKNWPAIHAYLGEGDAFVAGGTIVAGVVPSAGNPTCPHGGWDIAEDLESASETDLYAAIKAVGILGEDGYKPDLAAISAGGHPDWRIQLEALGSLARLDPHTWTIRLAQVAADVERPLEVQMEAVFILSEIPSPLAAQGLADVAQAVPGRHDEVRSAALWGLGTGAHPEPSIVLNYITDPSDQVALHAAAGLGDVTDPIAEILVESLGRGDRAAAVSAAILAKQRRIPELLAVAGSQSEGRLWALRALGDLPPADVMKSVGKQLDPSVREALDPIWVQNRDWLRTEKIPGPLDVLAAQRVRFDPINPHT